MEVESRNDLSVTNLPKKEVLLVRNIIRIAVIAIMLLGVYGLVVCKPEYDMAKGRFYDLQAAYEGGLLTVEDLKCIAHYQGSGRDEPDIVPIPKNPETLSDETIKAIKETYVVTLRAQTSLDGTFLYPRASVKNVVILDYFGTYNGFTALTIGSSFHGYPDVVEKREIAGVTFTYTGPFIMLWKAN